MSALTVIAIILAAFTFFILLWSGIIYLMSYVSGWKKLAESYSTTYIPSQMNTCSCIFRRVCTYNSVVRYAATPEGLYLNMIKLFSIGHKPLFIPWIAFESYESGKSFIVYNTTFRDKAVTEFKVKGVMVYINQDVKANINPVLIK